MQIKINDSPFEFKIVENESLNQLLARLDDYFQKSEQSIISLNIDGKVLTDENFPQLSNQVVNDFNSLNIEVLNNHELAFYTLKEVRPLLEGLTDVIKNTAEDLQGGKIEQAQKNMDPILQVWAVLFETISNASKYHQFKLADIKIDSSTLEEMIQQLSANLKNLETALQNNDYVMVSDILEYEIAEKIPQWIHSIDVLGEHLHTILNNGSSQQ